MFCIKYCIHNLSDAQITIEQRLIEHKLLETLGLDTEPIGHSRIRHIAQHVAAEPIAYNWIGHMTNWL